MIIKNLRLKMRLYYWGVSYLFYFDIFWNQPICEGDKTDIGKSNNDCYFCDSIDEIRMFVNELRQNNI